MPDFVHVTHIDTDFPHSLFNCCTDFTVSMILLFTDIPVLSLLPQADPEDYAECLSRASKSTYAQWIVQSAPEAKAHEVTNRLVILRKLFGRMRELLRVMGKEAGVEIEPPSQTLLADKTETMQGVLCAGVPGAGGHDAIFAIVLSYSARSQVEDMWSGWGSDGTAVCPLLLSAEGGLDGGVRVEEEMAWA
jgi:phosphomevalonate kinase